MLPSDVLVQVLEALDPSLNSVSTLLSVSLASRRLYSIAQDWRPWKIQALIRWPVATRKLCLDPSFRDWKSWYREQHLREKALIKKLVRLTEHTNYRECFALNIASAGDLAVDLLNTITISVPLEIEPYLPVTLGHSAQHPHWRVPEKWLAMRYWAKGTRDHHRRRRAVEIWKAVASKNPACSMEDVLAAYTAFRNGDPDSISPTMDHLTSQFLSFLMNCGSRSAAKLSDPWTLSLEIVDFMFLNGFRKAPNELHSDIDNHFINIILTARAGRRFSHPLNIVGIFISIARRIGLDAHLAKFPTHEFAVITGWLDPDHKSACHFPLFVDPCEITPKARVTYRSNLDHLPENANLRRLQSADPVRLKPASLTDICLRIHRNIEKSAAGTDDKSLEFIMSRYASLMAKHCITNSRIPIPMSRPLSQRNLLFLDHKLFDEIALEPEGLYPEEEEQEKRENAVRRRFDHGVNVKYEVGQIFEHIRYGYTGVIVGWSPTCEASKGWCKLNGVGRLSRGRNQPFYHIITTKGSPHYVGEENIQITRTLCWSHVAEFMINYDIGKHFDYPDIPRSGFVKGIELRAKYPQDLLFEPRPSSTRKVKQKSVSFP